MKKHIQHKIELARKYNDGPRVRKPLGTSHYTKAELSERYQAGKPLSESQHKTLFGPPEEEVQAAPAERISRKDFLQKRADAFHGIKDGQPQC